MGDGWDLNVPAAGCDIYGTLYPCTAGRYRYAEWYAGDVRAYLENATNVRVRDISLSYDAPDTWVRQLGARTLRLTFQARNPIVLTNYWSFDPEFNNFGATNLNRFIDLAPFPGNRQFYLSVDVGW